MVSKQLLTLTLLLAFNNLYCQDKGNYLARVGLNDKYGFVDTTGREVVPAVYDLAGGWSNNLVAVNVGAKGTGNRKKGGKWGYYNDRGVLVIPLQFDDAMRFYEGRAAVKTDGEWGFIDTAGNIVIPAVYDEVKEFSEGYCAVAINKKWGYINNKGVTVIPPAYKTAHSFKNGVAWVYQGVQTDSSILINKAGDKIASANYAGTGNFIEGFAKVEVTDSTFKTGRQNIWAPGLFNRDTGKLVVLYTGDEYGTKKGFINLQGKLVVPTIYAEAGDFSEGFAAVAVKDKNYTGTLNIWPDAHLWGYVNTRGEEVIKPQFSLAYKFIDGRAVVLRGRQRTWVSLKPEDSLVNYLERPEYALIDTNGKYLLHFDWDYMSPIGNDLLIARRKKHFGEGVVDIHGKTVISFIYYELAYAGNGLFTAKDLHAPNTYLVIDINNKVLLTTNKYEMLPTKSKYGSLNIYNHHDKSGFINLDGEPVIMSKYHSIGYFKTTNPTGDEKE